MVELGYSLSSEEHSPSDLVRYARMADDSGFAFAMISDHFHPWISRQGHSSFVWSVLGGIAEATDRLVVGTGVTCPTLRIHPAIIAQAAATTAAMMPGRFLLGLGSGENLNEHILGEQWPPADRRMEMLAEAVALIRRLWEGKLISHYGDYFVVENARIYTLPDSPPPILLAAGGPESAQLAGEISDGVISTSPDPEIVKVFERAGGRGKPRYGQMSVCWAKTESEARRVAREWWPTAAIKGAAKAELPLPQHFEQLVADVTEDQVAKQVICGPDPESHLAEIRKFEEAGYDHVYVHQVGPDQEGFFRFYREKILPRVREPEPAGMPAR